MDIKYINPFILATQNIFNTMVKLKINIMKPYIKKPGEPVSYISASIGMTGRVNGVISINFGREAACLVTSKFLGEKFLDVNDAVKDSIGEIANIIAGGAKRSLQEDNMDCKIALPSVVIGQNHSLSYPSGIPVMVIPFEVDEIRQLFYIEVCLKTD
jgi:chemotaxis protein CheX